MSSSSFRFWYTHKRTIVSIGIILLVALVSLLWFGGNYLLIGTDLIFSPNRIGIFLKTFSMWDPSGLGSPSPRMLAWSVPNGAFLGFSAIAGLSLENAEKLWFYFLFAFSGLSMYYLATIISKKKRHAIGVVAALFYMFNPFLALGITAWPYLWLTYASLPLVLGLFIKGLTEGKGLKYIVLVNLIWWVTSSSQYVNPKYVILDWIPLLAYLIFHIAACKDRSEFFRSIKFTGLLFGFWGLINIYWLLPTVTSISQVIAAPNNLYSVIGRSRLEDFALNSAPLPDLFRLLGSWILNSGFMGYPYVYWGSTYNTPLFIFIGYLIPVIAFAPLLLKRGKNIVFFSVFLIVALLLMNGAQAPFGWFNTFIFTHIPLAMDVFSIPYPIFGLYAMLSFAVLFGCGLISLADRISINKNKSLLKKLKPVAKPAIVGAIIFLVVGLYAFPIWTGEVAYPGNALLSGSRYQIPEYYYEAAKWLSSDSGNFRLFALPYTRTGYVSYSWEPAGYQGPDPTESLLGKSVITGDVSGNLGSTIAELIVSNSTQDVAKVLALMNVKYIVFHNDVNWAFLNASSGQAVISSYISTSQQNFKANLASAGGFTFCASFGQLDFYRDNYWQPMTVYAASNNVISDGNFNQLMQIAERADFTLSSSMITLSSQLDANQILNLPASTEIVQNSNSEVIKPSFQIQNDSRIVFELTPQPELTARYYSSWKKIVSTNGQGDPGMIVFSSPSKCPYLNSFPIGFSNWSAYNSTIVYLTSPSQLTINSITADGEQVVGQAWWQTGTSWTTGWPISIPPNQEAAIQISQKASNITLQTNDGPLTVSVTDGWKYPFVAQNPSETSTSIYIPNAGDYLLALNVSTGSSYGNLSIGIDNQSFDITLSSQESGTTYSFRYIGPLSLSSGMHTITISEKSGSTPQITSMLLYSLKSGESFVNANNLLSSDLKNPAITYKEINPTQYTVQVTALQPFFLVLSESYDNGWVATINGQQISDLYHFIANGYANGWYINKTGTFTITLEYTPQNLFYEGAAVSITTLILCALYVWGNKIKAIPKHFRKANHAK